MTVSNIKQGLSNEGEMWYTMLNSIGFVYRPEE